MEDTRGLRKQKRSYIACERCRLHKIKCTGETPCRNCRVSRTGIDCVYPTRDRKINVSQRYLDNLEGEVQRLRRQVAGSKPSATPNHHVSDEVGEPCPFESSDYEEPFEHPFAEDEVHIVPSSDQHDPLFVGDSACTVFGSRIQHLLQGGNPLPHCHSRKYFNSHSLHRMSISSWDLPEKAYAKLLIQVMLRFAGESYFLALRDETMRKIDDTYTESNCNPVWLCKLFAMLAVGELYSKTTSRADSQLAAPGVGFFMQAVSMQQDLYEEANADYIELLVLMSLYSQALNRTATAHSYIGIALRLSMVLGLHRKKSNGCVACPVQKQRLCRLWWTVYCIDRFSCARLGQPLTIHDDDIDICLPSMDDLSDRDQKEFNNPTSQAEMIRLAQIMGHVLKIVYKIPKKNERQDLFANVRTTLIRLREWNNSLPESLRLNTATSPAFSSRAVASMHLRYNESIIMATRPVLFHYLKTTLRRPPDASSPISKSVANISSELGEACISAARANNTLLIELYVHGSLATYGLYDAIYVFSSTVILFLSNTLHRNRDNEDRIQTGWNLLQSMNDEGSIPAAEYLQRLSHLKKDFENAWEQGITPAKEETSVLTSTSFAVDERQNIGSSDDYESKPLHKHDGVDNIESLLIEQFDFSFLLEEVENATKADLNPWTGIEINWSPNEYRLF